MHSHMKNFVKILCCHILYRVKYIHLENLPKDGNYLICPNHSNVFDPTFIFPLIDNIFIMAKADLFKNKFVAKLFHHYQIFPIHREKTDSKSLFYSLEILKTNPNAKLLMFPEGGICKTEEEIGKKIKKGAIYLASNAEVPIVPVYITRRPRLFSKVNVIFGNPILIESDVKNNKEEVLEESQKLIKTIYQLRKEDT